MKYYRLLTFIFSILLCGCTNTVGHIELKGKVVDDSTKTPIPNISVTVHALDYSDDDCIKKYIGDFTTDSSGRFAYTLKKVKNVSVYNFFIDGDPAYAESNIILGLTDLNMDGEFLSFRLKRIADFTIKIDRVNKTSFYDTLLVSWETNGIDGKTLYPYEIDNYHINSGNGLIWIGGDVKSEIKTKVYADKNTIVHWELYRNGSHKDIIDTIFCKRDAANSVYFKY